MCRAADTAGRRRGQGKAIEGTKSSLWDTLGLNIQVEMSCRCLQILVWNLGADWSWRYALGNYLNMKGTGLDKSRREEVQGPKPGVTGFSEVGNMRGLQQRKYSSSWAQMASFLRADTIFVLSSASGSVPLNS